MRANSAPMPLITREAVPRPLRYSQSGHTGEIPAFGPAETRPGEVHHLGPIIWVPPSGRRVPPARGIWLPCPAWRVLSCFAAVTGSDQTGPPSRDPALPPVVFRSDQQEHPHHDHEPRRVHLRQQPHPPARAPGPGRPARVEHRSSARSMPVHRYRPFHELVEPVDGTRPHLAGQADHEGRRCGARWTCVTATRR